MNKFQFFVLVAIGFNILARVSVNWQSVAFFVCSMIYCLFAVISAFKNSKIRV